MSKFSWPRIRALYPDLALLRSSLWSGKLLLDDSIPRSFIWKLCLVFNSYDTKKWTTILQKWRAEYSSHMMEYLGDIFSAQASSTSQAALTDPLSSSWHGAEHTLDDEELKDIITKDVERTFPDLEFFRASDTQESLFNILYVYAKNHPDIAYKQGMHELAGTMLWVVHQDLDKLTLEDAGADKSTMQADSFMLFSALMTHAKDWYMPASTHMGTPAIVEKSANIESFILKAADPKLFNLFHANQIEPQIWGLRWIRLLFGREFGFTKMLYLWDALFAATYTENGNTSTVTDTKFPYTNRASYDELIHILNEYNCIPLNTLVDFVAATLLLRISPHLLSQDMHTSDILVAVLNYSSESVDVKTMHSFVSNALYLVRKINTTSPTTRESAHAAAEAGYHVTLQYNSDLLPSVTPATLGPGLGISVNPTMSANIDSLVDKARRSMPWDDMDRMVRSTFKQVKSQVKTQAERAKARSIQHGQTFVNNSTLKNILNEINNGGSANKTTQIAAAVLENALHVFEVKKLQIAELSADPEYNSAIEYLQFAKDFLLSSNQSFFSVEDRKDKHQTAKKYLVPIIKSLDESDTEEDYADPSRPPSSNSIASATTHTLPAPVVTSARSTTPDSIIAETGEVSELEKNTTPELEADEVCSKDLLEKSASMLLSPSSSSASDDLLSHSKSSATTGIQPSSSNKKSQDVPLVVSVPQDSTPAPIRIRTRMRKNKIAITNTSIKDNNKNTPESVSASHAASRTTLTSEFAWMLGDTPEKESDTSEKKSSTVNLFGMP